MFPFTPHTKLRLDTFRAFFYGSFYGFLLWLFP